MSQNLISHLAHTLTDTTIYRAASFSCLHRSFLCAVSFSPISLLTWRQLRRHQPWWRRGWSETRRFQRAGSLGCGVNQFTDRSGLCRSGRWTALLAPYVPPQAPRYDHNNYFCNLFHLDCSNRVIACFVSVILFHIIYALWSFTLCALEICTNHLAPARD